MAVFLIYFTVVLWWAVVISIFVTPLLLFYWLFTKVRAIFYAFGRIEEEMDQFKDLAEVKSINVLAHRFPSPTGNEETLLETRTLRERIKLTRRQAKDNRLKNAVSRWHILGLVYYPKDFRI